MSRLGRRLVKLEGVLPPLEAEFSREEIHIAQLALARAVSRSRHPPEITNRAHEIAVNLEDMIISTKVKQDTEQFRRHIADYVQPTWQTRWGRTDYLPPIVGSEYDDWEVPDLYVRRCTLRHCTAVVDLIGPPDPVLCPTPEHIIPWNLVFAQILNWILPPPEA